MKFTVVFVQVVKKSALDVQNLLFFSFTYWAHCRRRHRHLRRCSQDLSMCVNGQESEHGFSKHAFIFSLDIYVIKIRSINELLRFSGNPHLRGEGKKVSCFRKRKNFSKKQPELNELRQTVHAFKIIIFRYFAFFLELTFYFLLFNHYYLLIIFIYFLCTTFSAYRAYRQLPPCE